MLGFREAVGTTVVSGPDAAVLLPESEAADVGLTSPIAAQGERITPPPPTPIIDAE